MLRTIGVAIALLASSCAGDDGGEDVTLEQATEKGPCDAGWAQRGLGHATCDRGCATWDNLGAARDTPCDCPDNARTPFGEWVGCCRIFDGATPMARVEWTTCAQ